MAFRSLLLALSMMLSGCAMWPYKERYIIATRPESVTNTNVFERLIQSDTGMASWALLKPCYAGPAVNLAPIHRSFFARDRAGRRTDLAHFEFLQEKVHPDWTGRRNLYFGYGRNVRPVIGTNLWLMMNMFGERNSRHAKVYVFEPRRIVIEREVIGLNWEPDNFRLDANNRRLTYRTENGYQTFDLVDGTSTTAPNPP